MIYGIRMFCILFNKTDTIIYRSYPETQNKNQFTRSTEQIQREFIELLILFELFSFVICTNENSKAASERWCNNYFKTIYCQLYCSSIQSLSKGRRCHIRNLMPLWSNQKLVDFTLRLLIHVLTFPLITFIEMFTTERGTIWLWCFEDEESGKLKWSTKLLAHTKDIYSLWEWWMENWQYRIWNCSKNIINKSFLCLFFFFWMAALRCEMLHFCTIAVKRWIFLFVCRTR